MRTVLIAALIVPQIGAMFAQTCPNVSKPRFEHGPRFSQMFSYPSSGGFVRKQITRVELEWLGLNLFTSSENTVQDMDEEEENSLSLRLMQLGGRWWPSRAFWKRHSIGVDDYYGHNYPSDLDIAYCPDTGEVMVLRTWSETSEYVFDLPNLPLRKSGEWSKLSLCTTMQERCDVLREFGAEVYSSADECGDIPQTLEEGIEQGRGYVQLLKKMEDKEYAIRWADEL